MIDCVVEVMGCKPEIKERRSSLNENQVGIIMEKTLADMEVAALAQRMLTNSGKSGERLGIFAYLEQLERLTGFQWDYAFSVLSIPDLEHNQQVVRRVMDRKMTSLKNGLATEVKKMVNGAVGMVTFLDLLRKCDPYFKENIKGRRIEQMRPDWRDDACGCCDLKFGTAEAVFMISLKTATEGLNEGTMVQLVTGEREIVCGRRIVSREEQTRMVDWLGQKKVVGNGKNPDTRPRVPLVVFVPSGFLPEVDFYTGMLSIDEKANQQVEQWVGWFREGMEKAGLKLKGKV